MRCARSAPVRRPDWSATPSEAVSPRSDPDTLVLRSTSQSSEGRGPNGRESHCGRGRGTVGSPPEGEATMPGEDTRTIGPIHDRLAKLWPTTEALTHLFHGVPRDQRRALDGRLQHAPFVH